MHAELLSAVSKKAPDISESLRLEIVSYTMRGIQETARASSGSEPEPRALPGDSPPFPKEPRRARVDAESADPGRTERARSWEPVSPNAGSCFGLGDAAAAVIETVSDLSGPN